MSEEPIGEITIYFDNEEELEELVERIKKEIENKIFVIIADVRYSETTYNYKKKIAIAFRPICLTYEEQDTRSVEILNISCGMFQEYPVKCLEIIKSELENVAIVEIIDIF